MKKMGLSHAGFSYVKSRTLGKSRICTSLYMAVCRDTILLSTTKGYCSALGLEGKNTWKGFWSLPSDVRFSRILSLFGFVGCFAVLPLLRLFTVSLEVSATFQGT